MVKQLKVNRGNSRIMKSLFLTFQIKFSLHLIILMRDRIVCGLKEVYPDITKSH